MTVAVHGLPPLVREGLEVFVVPPRLKGPRSHVVASVSDGPRGQLVSLSGVGGIEGADALRGRYLLARECDLPDDVALHDAEALLGREVEDERLGFLGTIGEVMVGPANDVWVIEGPFGEVLVPVVDEVVSEVPDNGPIAVRTPSGLVDGGGDQ
ncbi:16S rRNA processing protein RimM [Olsenella sp. Marseille-P4559]|uniref:16S rRNA processing protein RimM n=1 Tax=Olsenella sp. Marseille-P4559 TaxID=2364795 RepID=UPI001F5F1772|nr:16S rRNA processing protein RimM [Olsenella sp. Marseille-P4559]